MNGVASASAAETNFARSYPKLWRLILKYSSIIIFRTLVFLSLPQLGSAYARGENVPWLDHVKEKFSRIGRWMQNAEIAVQEVSRRPALILEVQEDAALAIMEWNEESEDELMDGDAHELVKRGLTHLHELTFDITTRYHVGLTLDGHFQQLMITLL